MANENSVRNSSGPGNGRAVGQNRDSNPGRGVGNNRSATTTSSVPSFQTRSLEVTNQMMSLRETLDSNNEIFQGWEKASGNPTPPGQAKKQEQGPSPEPPGLAKKSDQEPPGQARKQEPAPPLRQETQEPPRPEKAASEPSGLEKKPDQEPPGLAKKEAPAQPEPPRLPATEGKNGEPPGLAKKEAPPTPEPPGQVRKQEPPPPKKEEVVLVKRESEPPPPRTSETVLDKLSKANDARRAEAPAQPQHPPEPPRKEAPLPRPPETPARPPAQASIPRPVVKSEGPPAPPQPKSPQPEQPASPQTARPALPRPAPDSPSLLKANPQPPRAPAPEKATQQQQQQQNQATAAPRPTEAARLARAEIPVAPAPTPAPRNDRGALPTRGAEEPTTHITVQSRGSAEGAEHHTQGDAEAQAQARQAETRPIRRDIRENRLLTRFLLPGKGDLEEELEALKAGPRVEKIGERQQGKGGGGQRQSGGQSSGEAGGQAAPAEAGLEGPLDPMTGLPRTLVRPGLLPLVPHLEQLFQQVGLAYVPETEETPQFLRSFWIALAWLSHHEQTGLSERMVYFGAAMFDGMQGWRRKYQQGEEQTVNRLLAMLAQEGGFLGEHSLRVMTLSDAVCDDMKLEDPSLREEVRSGALLRDLGMAGFDSEQLPPMLAAQAEQLRGGGNLHMAGRLADLGSLRIPEEIRNKPGPLDDWERALMEKHPEYSEQFLQPFPAFRHLGPIVRAHHERWDGRGYPDGLMGRRIPLASRIIAVADVWDALTSDRPWRPAWDFDSAYRYIEKNAGTQFDPEVVKAFLKTTRRLKAGGYLD